MLVRVEVREPKAGLGDAVDLPPCLALQLAEVDAPAEVARQERAPPRQELRRSRREERAHLGRGRRRVLGPAYEGEVHADVEPGRLAQHPHGVMEGTAARDDAAGGEDPLVVRAQDAAGDARMKTDVVAGRDQEADRSDAAGAGTARASFRRGCFISG